MEFLESSHFPDEMQGRVIIGGYYGNTLEQHRLDYDEKTGRFSTELLPNLIETKNNVFRPIEVRVGPDGALYVTDWYNPIIGHYQASYRHPDRDKEHGRIWRVTAKGRPLVKPSSLADATLSDLLALVDSPERWTALQAKRLLFEKDSAAVVAALDAWVPTLKADDAKDELQPPPGPLPLRSPRDPPPRSAEKPPSFPRSEDPRLRHPQPLHLGPRRTPRRSPHPARNPDRRSRSPRPARAIVACSYVADPRTALVAARALDHDFNDYHRHALTKTLHATHHLWAPQLTKGFSFERDEHLLFALQNSWVENNPDDLKNLTGGAVDYRPQAASGDVRAVIRQQVARSKTNPAASSSGCRPSPSPPPPTTSPSSSSAREHPGLLAAIQSRPRAIPPPSSIPSGPATIPRCGARPCGSPACGRPAPTPTASAPSPSTRPRPSAAPAFSALLVLDTDAAVAHQLARLREATDPAAAASILSTLLAQAQGHAGLVRALGQPDALPPAAAKHALNALNQIGRAEPKLTAPLMKLAGLNPALPDYTKEYVANLVKAAKTFGNADEGKKIYETAGCIACHIPGATQSKIGPDLSAISRGLPPELIVTELVWPALNVKEGYEAATVTLKDGTVVTGFNRPRPPR